MLYRSVSGRISLGQVTRDNLDIGRPDKVGLVFHRHMVANVISGGAGSDHTRRTRRPGVLGWRRHSACSAIPTRVRARVDRRRHAHHPQHRYPPCRCDPRPAGCQSTVRRPFPSKSLARDPRRRQAEDSDRARLTAHVTAHMWFSASVRTARSRCSMSSNSGWPMISGGASWITGSPRSSARQ